MRNFQLFPKRFGFMPYVFLIYIAMPGYYIANEAGIKEVIGFVLLFIFLITYRQLYCLMGEKAYSYWLAAQMIIIFILAVWYSPNNLFLGFFPANFIGWYEDEKFFKRALISFIVVLSVTFIVPVIKGEISYLYYLLPFFIIMIASPFGIRSLNKSMQLEQKLDQANEQIKTLIKREERVRIARDLHDTLGHTLSLITLQSQLVQRLAGIDAEQAKASAKEIEKTSRSALRQVRELVSEMRAITVAEELVELNKILQAANITLHSEGEIDLSELSLLQQNIVGMCLREAGTNIIKHSQAKHCIIILEKTRGYFTVKITDDGVGLREQSKSGNGLKGMKERLALIEGELAVRSENGTTLCITIPVVMKEEKEGIA